MVATNLRGGGRGGAEDTPETPIDPVCHMEVNPTWGFEHEHQGRIVRFCSQRCQALFEVGPDQYLQEQCLVCREPVQAGSGVPATYMNKTYMLDSQACRDRFKTEPGSYFMHTMWGIPDWLYYVSIGVVLLVSFLMFEGTALFRRRRRAVVHLPVLPEPTRSMHRNAGTGSDRIDLMRWAVVRTFLRSRPARAFVQLFVVCVFLLIIAAGLFGNQNPALNIAPLLTWIEIGFGVTMRPAATAWLALAMLSMAIVCAFVFDRKSFCRYGCLVGRVSGLYALFAGVEVRRRDDAVCGACRTRECVRGSDVAYACPTFENPAKMHLSTYCIQCTECLQSCPHGNMTVKLRPWGADLAAEGRPRKDEAYLALLMLAISSFHGLTMTPVWGRLTGAIESFVGAGRIV